MSAGDPILARIAEALDMRPERRYGGWSREPFGPHSDSHVSVWRME